MSGGDAQASADARIFVRAIDIPPGAPWDQWRAAKLEARYGAPLGEEAVAWALRRVAPWRPRAQGRFAVAYVRRPEAPERELVTEIEGAKLRFRFHQPELAARRLRSWGLTAACVAVAISALGVATSKALDVRAARDQELSKLELNARLWAAVRRKEQQAQSEAAMLRESGVEGRSFADLAADLFWLGQAKAPSVAFQRVQWRGQELLVLALGPGEPVIGNERSLEPVGMIAGAREWRIGPPPAGVVRQGVARPSVVSSGSENGGGA